MVTKIVVWIMTMSLMTAVEIVTMKAMTIVVILTAVVIGKQSVCLFL